MFKYSRKAGILSVVALVLAVLPLVIAIAVIPGLPDSVPMSAGGDGRWGSRYELFIAPALALAFGLGIYLQTARKAAEHAKSSMAMAVATAERFMRNAVLTVAVINVANAYLIYTVITALRV